MIEERDGLFIQSSLELESLGEVLFSSVTVNDRQKDSCVIKFGGNGGICIGKTTNFVSLNRVSAVLLVIHLIICNLFNFLMIESRYALFKSERRKVKLNTVDEQ